MCGGGGGYATETRSHALTHSVSQPTNQPASYSVRQTKKSSILQEDITLPGDGASYPCIALGGPEEVGTPGLGGFVSTAEYLSLHTQIHTSIRFSVDLLAIKAIITHQSICAADKCVLVVFLMWVIRVFLFADWRMDADGGSCTSLL